MRKLAFVAGVPLIALAAWMILSPKAPDHPPPEPKPTPTPTRTSTGSSPAVKHPAVEPEHPVAATPDAGMRREIPFDKIPHEANTPEPLVGLGLVTLDDGLRQRLSIPEKYKGGVVLTEVDPRSPGAEVHLQADDVIVQANTERVTSIDELTQVVREREHTMVVVFRNGKPFNVVLHKPWRGP